MNRNAVRLTRWSTSWPGPIARTRGLHRWTEWLRSSLSPARVEMADPGVLEDGALWKIRFPNAGTTRIRVDHRMLMFDAETFDDITRRLDHHGWVGALKASGDRGLHLSRWVAV